MDSRQKLDLHRAIDFLRAHAALVRQAPRAFAVFPRALVEFSREHARASWRSLLSPVCTCPDGQPVPKTKKTRRPRWRARRMRKEAKTSRENDRRPSRRLSEVGWNPGRRDVPILAFPNWLSHGAIPWERFNWPKKRSPSSACDLVPKKIPPYLFFFVSLPFFVRLSRPFQANLVNYEAVP